MASLVRTMPSASQLLKTAIDHHKAERFADAEKAYKKLLHIGGIAQPDGLRLLGALYLQMGKKTLAAEYLGKAARLLPDDPETLTNLGIALGNLNRPDDAIQQFKQALTRQSTYVPALSNLGRICYEIGRMDEAEAAYGAASRLDPSYAPAHVDHGNSLLSQGKYREAIAAFHAALNLNPNYLSAMVNLCTALAHAGETAQHQEWLARTQSFLEKTVQADPDNPAMLNNLGVVLRQRGKPKEAIPYYQKALRLRPDYPEAMVNLASSLHDVGRLDEAIEMCRNVLRLKPACADTKINLGTYLQERGEHPQAVSLFAEALKTKPASIYAKWNQCLSLLALGRYGEGWTMYEEGLGVATMRGAYAPERRWMGENLNGKRLLIRSEQGLGDSIQFIRYAELCKERGASVSVFCQPPLRKLFSRCPYIDEVLEQNPESGFDFHIPMMSFPLAFGTEVESIPYKTPYLSPGEKARAKWRERFDEGSGIKVGIVWAGNPREKQINAHLIDLRRSMDLEKLRPLLTLEGIRFYSLQKGAKAAQIKTCGLDGLITDFMDEVDDFEDTAAIVEHLDLVISVDTSVAHLAGAMGKSVWILSRFDACWRWLQNRPDTPWYPSARVIGQAKPGDWDSAVEKVREQLLKSLRTTN
ncbi:MAG: tetratricopeptide repeat protein [Alphaproteobacteria bacterium]|nr:tetratricopeptide repeat protein [Alphaproteobacteria bacterium]